MNASPADPAPADPTPVAPVIADPAVIVDLPPLVEAPEAVRLAREANVPASVVPIELAPHVDAAPGAFAAPQPRARRIAWMAGVAVGLIALLGILRALLRPATERGEAASIPQATRSVAAPPPVAEKAPVPKPVADVPPAAPAAASVVEPETSPGIEPTVAPEPPREAPPLAASKALPAARALPAAPVQARPASPVAPVWARPPAPPPPPLNGASGTEERSEPPPKPYRPKKI